MKKIYLMMLVALTSYSHPSMAQEKSDVLKAKGSWQTDKIKAQQFIQDNECNEEWSVLWPHARSGNVEAKAIIFSRLLSTGHGSGINTPLNVHGDRISSIKDSVIFFIHSLEIKYVQLPENTKYIQESTAAIRADENMHSFMLALNGKRTLKCLEHEQNQSELSKCIHIAVEDKVVPSFEAYARDIDLAAQLKKVATCN